jgi:hypothetical protein
MGKRLLNVMMNANSDVLRLELQLVMKHAFSNVDA